jgi:mRNA-degrading endonuclease RelE of RelBE toxin-antitoxin system
MYEVVLSDESRNFLFSLDKKSRNICKKNLKKLFSPYPGRGIGDKEKLVVAGEEVYRLHIGRTYTAFYIVDEIYKIVRVLEILSIEMAHKKYGF